MKKLGIIAISLIISGCANAQAPMPSSKFDILGGELPAIRHMVDMKTVEDTLLFAYESEDGYGER